MIHRIHCEPTYLKIITNINLMKQGSKPKFLPVTPTLKAKSISKPKEMKDSKVSPVKVNSIRQKDAKHTKSMSTLFTIINTEESSKGSSNVQTNQTAKETKKDKVVQNYNYDSFRAKKLINNRLGDEERKGIQRDRKVSLSIVNASNTTLMNQTIEKIGNPTHTNTSNSLSQNNNTTNNDYNAITTEISMKNLNCISNESNRFENKTISPLTTRLDASKNKPSIDFNQSTRNYSRNDPLASSQMAGGAYRTSLNAGGETERIPKLKFNLNQTISVSNKLACNTTRAKGGSLDITGKEQINSERGKPQSSTKSAHKFNWDNQISNIISHLRNMSTGAVSGRATNRAKNGSVERLRDYDQKLNNQTERDGKGLLSERREESSGYPKFENKTIYLKDNNDFHIKEACLNSIAEEKVQFASSINSNSSTATFKPFAVDSNNTTSSNSNFVFHVNFNLQPQNKSLGLVHEQPAVSKLVHEVVELDSHSAEIEKPKSSMISTPNFKQGKAISYYDNANSNKDDTIYTSFARKESFSNNSNYNSYNYFKNNSKSVIKKYSVIQPGLSNDSERVCQDNSFLFTNFNGNKDLLIAGVLDGHGVNGHIVSAYLKNNLPKWLDKEFILNNLIIAQENIDKQPIGQTINDVFVKTNTTLNQEMDTTNSGSTCSLIIMSNKHLITANVGDSRAILGRKINSGWNFIDLTRDHKPSMPDESQRIIMMGGEVRKHIDNKEEVGPFRLFKKGTKAPGLAMSRSFGDSNAEKIGKISNPEINFYEFSSGDKFILIASDGIWDFMSSYEVMLL